MNSIIQYKIVYEKRRSIAIKVELGRVIVKAPKSTEPEYIEKLVSKHENIFMILCGHDSSSTIVMKQTAGDNGNIVTQMLINPQGVDGGQTPTGMVAMLYFAKDGRSIEVEYYSTVRNMY